MPVIMVNFGMLTVWQMVFDYTLVMQKARIIKKNFLFMVKLYGKDFLGENCRLA
jgi:hypothetical protein